MAHIVDARGLACPQPVILTKKALSDNGVVEVLVDDTAAFQNVKRLAASLGCTVEEAREGSAFRLRITRGGSCARAEDVISRQGPVVLVMSSENLGRGDDVLGTVLVKSFLHTLTEISERPDVVIFLNSGVKLAVEGSEVLDDVKALADAGVRILACGTCLNYFGLKERLGAGVVSNMYDIAQTMLTAGRLVQV